MFLITSKYFTFTEYQIKWACLHRLWLCASRLQDKYACVYDL